MNRNVNTPTAQNYRSSAIDNYQNNKNQSNNVMMNKSNLNRNYEYYYVRYFLPTFKIFIIFPK
jgi:hypothetical protein